MARWLIPLGVLTYIAWAIVATGAMPTFRAGYANGTIHFKPECQKVAMQLIDVFGHGTRPLTQEQFVTIQHYVDKCNDVN